MCELLYRREQIEKELLRAKCNFDDLRFNFPMRMVFKRRIEEIEAEIAGLSGAQK